MPKGIYKRRNYTSEIDAKLQEYLDQYEVTNANDRASLKNMATLEIAMEKNQKALLATDGSAYPKKVRDLTASIRDLSNSFNQLQQELGISRKKRQENKEDDNPRTYVEWLKENAPKFLEKRLKVLTCDKCGQPLAKYFIYVLQDGEDGAIDTKIKKYPFSFKVACWKCSDRHKRDKSYPENVVEHNETTVYTPPKNDFVPTRLSGSMKQVMADRPTEQGVMKMVKEYDDKTI